MRVKREPSPSFWCLYDGPRGLPEREGYRGSQGEALDNIYFVTDVLSCVGIIQIIPVGV